MSTHYDVRKTLHQLWRDLPRRIRWLTRLPIILFSLFVVLHILYPPSIEWLNGVLHLPTPNLTTSLGLALLVGVLERVFVLEEIITGRSLHIYTEQQLMYRDLERLVDEFGAKQAILIQYSCSSCLSLVRTLRAKEADVTVYIQTPETASAVGSSLQKGRIERRCLDLPNELADLYSPEKFHLFQYSAPASISGVLIDRSFLGMGWYIYKHIDQTNRHNVRSADRVQLLGHNVPAVLTRAGTPEFDILYDCFTSMLANFKTNGKPVELNPGATTAHH